MEDHTMYDIYYHQKTAHFGILQGETFSDGREVSPCDPARQEKVAIVMISTLECSPQDVFPQRGERCSIILQPGGGDLVPLCSLEEIVLPSPTREQDSRAIDHVLSILNGRTTCNHVPYRLFRFDPLLNLDIIEIFLRGVPGEVSWRYLHRVDWWTEQEMAPIDTLLSVVRPKEPAFRETPRGTWESPLWELSRLADAVGTLFYTAHRTTWDPLDTLVARTPEILANLMARQEYSTSLQRTGKEKGRD